MKKIEEKDELLCWSVDLPNYLKDIVRNCSPNPEMAIESTLPVVLSVFADLAQLAIKINDPRLHLMMMRLNLYDLTPEERAEKMKQMAAEIKDLGTHESD